MFSSAEARLVSIPALRIVGSIAFVKMPGNSGAGGDARSKRSPGNVLLLADSSPG